MHTGFPVSAINKSVNDGACSAIRAASFARSSLRCFQVVLFQVTKASLAATTASSRSAELATGASGSVVPVAGLVEV